LNTLEKVQLHCCFPRCLRLCEPALSVAEVEGVSKYVIDFPVHDLAKLCVGIEERATTNRLGNRSQRILGCLHSKHDRLLHIRHHSRQLSAASVTVQ
ncbi:unnamed protein product, partial [Sphacelaria rigidula]